MEKTPIGKLLEEHLHSKQGNVVRIVIHQSDLNLLLQKEKQAITISYEHGVTKGAKLGLELIEIPTDNSLSEKYFNEKFENGKDTDAKTD